MARAVAALPGSQGGLGLTAARRTSPAAYWAGWADALAVLRERCPRLSEDVLRVLEADAAPEAPSLRELRACAELLFNYDFLAAA